MSHVDFRSLLLAPQLSGRVPLDYLEVPAPQ